MVEPDYIELGYFKILSILNSQNIPSKIPSIGALCICIKLHYRGHSLHRTACRAPGGEAFHKDCYGGMVCMR